MSKILVDLDCVLVDFYNHPDPNLKIDKNIYNSEKMCVKGFFRHLKPLPHAIESIYKLMEKHDVWICTKPLLHPYFIPSSCEEKLDWVAHYIPELKLKVIFTQDKSMIKADYLIDDMLDNHSKTQEFIHFDEKISCKDNWKRVFSILREV